MIRIFKAITLILLFASPLLAQEVSITGKIISSEDSAGLPGVNIVVKGTTNGTVTDVQGNFSITASKGETLLFSYIGFTPQQAEVGNQTTINVALKPDQTELNEVVVTGYSTQQKRNILGAIATVSSKDIQNLPVGSIDQALQGQAPGIQVTSSSGTPGGGIKVVVRGNTSISASNTPLYIIDGIPVETDALSQRGFGGQSDNALSLINPNDIEDMKVLMDASLKAQYGARAANGVVVITTKRGKSGKTSFNFDLQRGIIDPTNTVELLNSTELVKLQREALINAGQNPDESGLIEGVTDGVNTDWIDEVLRRGIYQQYQLSSSGGNEKTKFYVSASYRDEEGIQLNNRFQRFQGTLNLDHKASDKLSFGNNLIIGRSKNNRVKGDNFLDGVYTGAVKSLPYYAPYDEQGKLIGPSSPGYAAFPNFNPVGQALLPKFETYTTKIIAGVFANYSILDNLSFRTKVSLDFNGVNEDQFESSQTAIGGYLENVGGGGYGVYSSAIYSTLINTNILTYNTTIGQHSIVVQLGTEFLQRKERTSSVSARLFPRDDFEYISDPDGNQIATVDQGGSFQVSNGLASYFVDLKYNYEEKYLASFTSRLDGSSRFGRGKRYGLFPTFSLGWRISQERFMERFNFINDLKLRASYGFTGNEQIGNFAFLGTFSGTTYNGVSGLSPDNLENKNLQWERTREINIGLDGTFVNGRISTSIDFYNNLTDHLLFAQPISLTTGFATVQGNVGEIANKGFGIALKTINIDRKVTWSTSINFSKNLNKVVSLADTLPIFRGYQVTPGDRTNAVVEGHPLGTFWGLVFQGVDPATGDAIYEDRNGDGTINGSDATTIGNSQADFIAGMTNNVSYKGFELNVILQCNYGNEMLNFSNATLLDAGQSLENNQVVKALDRWQKPGDITDVPRYEAENTYNNYHSSRFIEDGSYLRLKNVTLGYNIPKTWVDKYKLASARVYVSGTNLYTITNYTGSDPEVSTLDGSTTAQGIDFFTLPQVRTIMVGLSFGF